MKTYLRNPRPHAREQRDQHAHHPVPQVQHRGRLLPSTAPILAAGAATTTGVAVRGGRPDPGEGRDDVRGELHDHVFLLPLLPASGGGAGLDLAHDGD